MDLSFESNFFFCFFSIPLTTSHWICLKWFVHTKALLEWWVCSRFTSLSLNCISQNSFLCSVLCSVPCSLLLWATEEVLCVCLWVGGMDLESGSEGADIFLFCEEVTARHETTLELAHVYLLASLVGVG